MKDTTSNMVAHLNPLELTAAQVIRNFIQTHNLEDGIGRWSMELERRHKQEAKCTILNTSCQTIT